METIKLKMMGSLLSRKMSIFFKQLEMLSHIFTENSKTLLTTLHNYIVWEMHFVVILCGSSYSNPFWNHTHLTPSIS